MNKRMNKQILVFIELLSQTNKFYLPIAINIIVFSVAGDTKVQQANIYSIVGQSVSPKGSLATEGNCHKE